MAKTRNVLGLVFSIVMVYPLWWTLGVAADIFSDSLTSTVLSTLRIVILAGPLIFLYEITQDVMAPTTRLPPRAAPVLTDQHVADATAAAIEHGVDPALAIAAVAEHFAQAGGAAQAGPGAAPPPPPTGMARPAPPTSHVAHGTSAAMKGAKVVWSIAAVVGTGLLLCGIALAIFVIWLLSQADCFLGC